MTGIDENQDNIEETRSPGRMIAEHTLLLETRMGQQMYQGRARTPDKHYIIGLRRFGGLMSSLYVRAQMDDPYFDYWLINIEEKTELTFETLKELRSKLEDLLNSNSKLEINVPESVNPIKVRLKYRNPYAYRAAELISEFDDICKLLNAAMHTARITREQFHAIRQEASKPIRSLLEHPLQYPTKGLIISREEYRQKTRKALEVIEKYGELPEDVISGKRRGHYAPPIKQAASLNLPKSARKKTVSLKKTPAKPQD